MTAGGALPASIGVVVEVQRRRGLLRIRGFKAIEDGLKDHASDFAEQLLQFDFECMRGGWSGLIVEGAGFVVRPKQHSVVEPFADLLRVGPVGKQPSPVR